MKNLLTAVLLVLAAAAQATDLPQRPDHALTPGAFNEPATPLDVLCTPGHSRQVRHVTRATKDQVFRAYGLEPTTLDRQTFEIDHLVPLSIDGTNDVTNLWPQSYTTQPLNAHKKDVVEQVLHRLVCTGQLDLRTAQQTMASDWVAAYRQYVSSGM